jgi:nicotinate-nucleotide--dimethylbenzimidazole phosphoribosyltransferase
MRDVERPRRLPAPPAELGRLGLALTWLAEAQGTWPPHAPAERRAVEIGTGGLTAGVAVADALADAGTDLLTVEGPPLSRPALVALCVLLDVEPVVAIGTAIGPGWSELVVAVRDALPSARADAGDAERLAADPVVGHATGLLAQAAVRRTPVVIGSSPVLAAAALLAERIAPGARRWWLAGSRSPGAAARLAYAELDLEPLLDLGLAVAGGAALAADLLVGGIELAVALHEERAKGV